MVTTMKRSDGIAYLTQCADRDGVHWWAGYRYPAEDCRTCNGTNYAGRLGVPCSRYGDTSAKCAPVAWRFAHLMARETGEEITLDSLDHAMSLVVNDHPDVAYLVRQYGNGHYR
jgi:hypothetical protein